MTASSDDLTIDELLHDPVTLALMRADRVDPTALEAMLHALAPAIEKRSGSRTVAFWSFGRRRQDEMSSCHAIRRNIRAELCGAS